MAANRILIVADSPSNLKVARFALESVGCEVRAATDPGETLESVRSFRPQAILLDMEMSGTDSVALARSIKGEPSPEPVVLVAVTGRAFGAGRDEALRELFDGVLTRPIDPVNLPLQLGEMLGRAQRSAEGAAPAPVARPHPENDVRQENDIRQIEKRVHDNEVLIQRWVLQEAQLAVLAGVAEVLAQNREVSDVLQDVLDACLDISGISKGALFLHDAGRLALRNQIGFSDHEVSDLNALFGLEDFLASVAGGGKVLRVPSAMVPAAVSQNLLQGANLFSLFLVPVNRGRTVYGLMLLGARAENVTSEDAQGFARVLGAQMGQAIGLARAFRELAASELRYRTLTENANDVICVLGPDGVIREANRRLTEILGYATEELVGQPISAFAASARTSDNAERIQARDAGSHGLTMPYEFRKKSGETALMEFSTATVEIGGEGLLFCIGRDVTDQVRAQAQLMAADRMVSIGTLAAGLAHEINNPLAAIVGNLEFAVGLSAKLEGRPADLPMVADLQAALSDARDAAQRVRQLTADLKLLSRAEETHRSSVDLQRVLDSTLRMAAVEVRQKAQLVRAFGEVPRVDGNESRLGQVFLNLIINAAQALPEGEAASNEIRITTRTDSAGRAAVEIHDTGPGIDPLTLKHIFKPFFTTKPAGIGTGLGLAICQRIVTGLGGEIRVASEVGKGTTFTVVLNPAGRDPAEAPTVKQPPRRGAVLLIDDDPLLGTAVSRSLSPEHEVTVMTEASQALKRVIEGPAFDVILCGVLMPGMTGMEFHQALREKRPDLAERVIFLTGGAVTAHARDYVARLGNARIEKPFDPYALRRLINDRVVSLKA